MNGIFGKLLACSTILFSLVLMSSPAYADDLSSLVKVTKSERSLTDRRTMTVTTTATVTITNSSTQSILNPVHAVFEISSPGVQVLDAIAPGAGNPYGKYYVNLTPRFTGGIFSPSGAVSFTVRLVCPSTVRYSYKILTFGSVQAANLAPVVAIAPVSPITLPAMAALSATVTDDGKVNPTPSLTWIKESGPGTVTFGTPGAVSTTASFSVDGNYVLRLNANDGALTGTATVSVTVNPAPVTNQPPTANAGQNRTVTIPYGQTTVSVTLDGSGSRDSDGTITSYIWSGTPDPADIVSPAISLGEGAYTFTLTVTDNKDVSSQASSVTVTVVKEVVRAPQLSLSSPPYTIQAGSTAPLIISVVAESPDGRKVSLSAAPLINNATFPSTSGVSASGSFNFRPDFSQAGKYFATFVARDVYDITSTVTVPIEVTRNNRSPLLTLQETGSMDEGGTLTIPVIATDPDGDIVTLTASGLPRNAILVPSAGSLTLTPDFTQAGTYPITITASDGVLSVSKTVTVTVRDVTGGNPGGIPALHLNVNPVESLTFLASQRITGTVNSSGGATVSQSSALITGMQPTTGAQGATQEVILYGDSGNYPSHFSNGISAASFGEGITVQSLTVTGPQQAVATIVIAPQAVTGSRLVTVSTASETAVSVLAFSVTRGATTVTGRLIDQDTGQPIGGATAVIRGTPFSATTGANGIFSISGVPGGTQTLMLSASNYVLTTSSIDALPNVSLTVPDIYTRATVFIPSAAPSVSLMSLIGRSASAQSSNVTRDAAFYLFRDAWMLLGGRDAGILDEYGNQMNPQVSGSGAMSLTDKGVKRLAEQMSSGKTMSLQEILYAFSMGLNWSQNTPPALKMWMDRLQQMVDQAWSDPANMDNALAILIFNRGNSVAADPPKIHPEMRLNVLQANLFVSSLLIYTLDSQGNLASRSENPVLLAYNSNLLSQLFVNAINPTSQGGRSVMRNFWKNYFGAWSNFPLSTVASAAGTALGTAISFATVGGLPGTAVATGILSFVSGVVADIIIQMVVSMNLAVLVPQPPIPLKAEYYTENNQGRVKVRFNRSVSDSHPLEDKNMQIRFWYTLYRYDRPPLNFSDNPNAVAVKNICSNCPETYVPFDIWPFLSQAELKAMISENPLEIIDDSPVPGKINYYDMTVTRLVGMKAALTGTDENLGSTQNWAAGFFPSVGAMLGKSEILGPGILMTAVSPMTSLVNGLQQLTSDFSGMVVAYAGERPNAAADDIEVDPVKGFVYHSDLVNKTIYRSEWAAERLMQTTKFADPGFKESQVGLAVDSAGNVYTDNQGSDSSFGGRVFRFKPEGTREFAGVVNYFSQLLMFARPVSVSRMTMGPNGRLYVADEICNCIKELDVALPIEPSRIVGQIYANLGPHAEPVQDLAFGPNRALYVLSSPTVQQIPYDSVAGVATVPAPYLDLSSLNTSGFGGLAVDGYGNVYLSQKGVAASTGKVLMFPFDSCFANPYCTSVTIMDNLDQPGDIDLSIDGRSLFIATGGGKLEKKIFGFSGQIKDFTGNPLGGATVSIQTEPIGYGKAVKTDANGFFRFDEVFRADLVVPYLDITIEYDGKTQVFLTQLGQPNFGTYGHTLRNITFSP